MTQESPAAIATLRQTAPIILADNENDMQFDWRAISGPALTSATALIAISVDRYFMAIPDPAPLLICIVAFAGLRSGLASAMVSAAIAVASSALFVFDDGATSGYETADLVRLAMLAVTAAGAAGDNRPAREKKPGPPRE